MGAAILAIVLSAAAIIYTRTTTKRLSYLAFQEQLTSIEVSKGRRIIYSIDSINDIEKLYERREPEWDLANHAVNLWNTLAQYSRLRIVPRRLVREMWREPIKEIWPNLKHVIRFRRYGIDDRGRPDKWSSLVWFAESLGLDVSEVETPLG